MQRLTALLLFIAGVIVSGCGPKVSTSTASTPSGKYSEDISIWRPKETPTDTTKKSTVVATVNGKVPSKFVEPKFAVNHAVDAVLDSISEYNLVNGFVDGFTIQVYSGVKREEALNAKKELSISLPDIDADIQYVQPNFRVRYGKYYDRIEAQKDYLTIRRYFPNAIVIPDRIPIY
jgi:hypothetical protein